MWIFDAVSRISDAIWHFVFHLGEYIPDAASQLFVLILVSIILAGFSLFLLAILHHWITFSLFYSAVMIYYQVKLSHYPDVELISLTFRQKHRFTWMLRYVLKVIFSFKTLGYAGGSNLRFYNPGFCLNFRSFWWPSIYKDDDFQQCIDNGWQRIERQAVDLP